MTIEDDGFDNVASQYEALARHKEQIVLTRCQTCDSPYSVEMRCFEDISFYSHLLSCPSCEVGFGVREMAWTIKNLMKGK